MWHRRACYLLTATALDGPAPKAPTSRLGECDPKSGRRDRTQSACAVVDARSRIGRYRPCSKKRWRRTTLSDFRPEGPLHGQDHAKGDPGDLLRGAALVSWSCPLTSCSLPPEPLCLLTVNWTIPNRRSSIFSDPRRRWSGLHEGSRSTFVSSRSSPTSQRSRHLASGLISPQN